MTKAEAKAQFIRDYLGDIPLGDKPAIAEAWNNYTDMLCKEGQITSKQYNEWTHPNFTSADVLRSLRKFEHVIVA